MGLSSLDVDAAASENDPPSSESIPKSLLLRQKETVTSLLGRSTHKNQFKLDDLTTGVYEPLADLLKDKKFLVSEATPTSLDCLALGYLTLALYPDLPHAWTKTFMQTKYPKLATYTKRLAEICFNPPVRVTDALGSGKDETTAWEDKEMQLPWQPPSRPSVLGAGKLILTSIADALPVISQLRSDYQLRQAAIAADSEKEEDAPELNRMAQAQSRETYTQIAAVGTTLGLFVGYLFYEGIVSWPGQRAHEDGNKEKDFGEAGAMLGI